MKWRPVGCLLLASCAGAWLLFARSAQAMMTRVIHEPPVAQAACTPPAKPPLRPLVSAVDASLLIQVAEVNTTLAASRFDEAAARIEALIEVYPDRESLRTLLKAVRTAKSADVSHSAARNRVSVSQLSAPLRLRTILVSKRLVAIKDLADEKRAEAAASLLTDVKALTREAPDTVRIWLIQAEACLMLERPLEGKIAGRNLRELGATESRSASVQSVLDRLNAKGWLPDLGE